jgi:hypothetical protein
VFLEGNDETHFSFFLQEEAREREEEKYDAVRESLVYPARKIRNVYSYKKGTIITSIS